MDKLDNLKFGNKKWANLCIGAQQKMCTHFVKQMYIISLSLKDFYPNPDMYRNFPPTQVNRKGFTGCYLKIQHLFVNVVICIFLTWKDENITNVSKLLRSCIQNILGGGVSHPPKYLPCSMLH